MTLQTDQYTQMFIRPLPVVRPRWLIRSGCGPKLRGTGVESRWGRMFVIEVLHIQCSELVKGMECTVQLSMVPCTIKNYWGHSIRVGHIVPTSGFLLSRYCHDCAESDARQRAPWLCSKLLFLSLHLTQPSIWYNYLVFRFSVGLTFAHTSCVPIHRLK